MPLKTNEICFGGPFHPPAKSAFYDIEAWGRFGTGQPSKLTEARIFSETQVASGRFKIPPEERSEDQKTGEVSNIRG